MTLVGAEDAVVITVGWVVWFEGWWEGREEVALEAGEREIRKVVTGRERVVDDRINVVLGEVAEGVGVRVVMMGAGVGPDSGFVGGKEGTKVGDGENLKMG